MDRRIFGVETEYGITCTFRGQQRLSEEAARPECDNVLDLVAVQGPVPFGR